MGSTQLIALSAAIKKKWKIWQAPHAKTGPACHRLGRPSGAAPRGSIAQQPLWSGNNTREPRVVSRESAGMQAPVSPHAPTPGLSWLHPSISLVADAS